jgi:hypothetical protein
MKVFLRNTTTRRFCAGPARWVEDRAQATDFRTIPSAARFALDQHLPHTEIILNFRFLRDDIILPVIPERSPSGNPHLPAP